MSDALAVLLRLNLALAAAVGLTMLLRRPVRRLFGPRIAYGLWALIPAAMAAMLLPARIVRILQPAAAEPTLAISWHTETGFTLQAAQTRPSVLVLLAALWLAGGAVALAHLVWRQAQFGRAVRAGRAGPAVVGLLRPRIVTPDDFTQRYTPREQRVVLAHEETHIARLDPLTNVLVALARCLNWFNPLAHVLAHYLRIDQELACDARVVAAYPAARRSYAEAMLKTQLTARPLPLGCYWPAPSAHPLAERIGLLSRRGPGRAARALGGAGVAALVLAAACAAWAARPAEVVAAPQPAVQAKTEAPATAAEAAPRQPLVGLTEVTDDPAKAGPGRRLLPPGFFGPPRKALGAARWSSVDPGSAVRVLATMQDPDGVPLTTDLTAFGSQSRYRLGYVRRDFSHYRLFTSVVQRGDRFQVTAGLNKAFSRLVTGSIELAAGETGTIALPSGLQVNVTPTVRPQTAEEIAEARGPARVDVTMHPRQF
ncbi:MAG TPA: M56 family metallopeptidase [Phenylobacterium sp.]|jgi:beta-lactamase regulating signal transducer with metallopeptidase domain|uniref:M56 family metallopeptidase n=1 Tax=Phenylobacterium sp. TaxID=1871053 RepID=UPI002D6D2171|nr:M56 family metallopeptidase [Phenylobacterium sp.]HZZ66620.1 M56 family metallopeptidase [Phenylobacterium sp.]